MSVDPHRDPELIRDSRQWPAWPWLPVKRPPGDPETADSEVGLIYEEDVAADGVVRVFEATGATAQSLMAGHLIAGRDLPVRVEYDSLEAMLEDGWRVD